MLLEKQSGVNNWREKMEWFIKGIAKASTELERENYFEYVPFSTSVQMPT